MRYVAVIASLLCVATCCSAQTVVLTNQDITHMVSVGLSPTIIEMKISKSTCTFDTSISALSSLKDAGVPDSVMAAMMQCQPQTARHDKPHVWIGANQEWIGRSSASAIATASSNSAFVTSAGKDTVQSHSEYPDVSRQLSPDKCPAIVITGDPNDSDYAITIERFNAGHLLTQRNSFSIFRSRDGSLLMSNTTTWLKNAAADMCRAITADAVVLWPHAAPLQPAPGSPQAKASN